MSNDTPRSSALPANPDLEHLKNEAKERLALLRATAPDAQLADAQFQVARDYGFSSWRALKDKVEGQRGELSAYVGFYRHDPALITNLYLSVTQSDGRLLVERTNGAKLELTREEDGRFASPGLSVLYGFEKDKAGHVHAMTVDGAQRHSRLLRIDAETAKTIDAANARALKDQRRPRTAITLAPDILDRHIGHYASPLGVAMEITHENAILYARIIGLPRLRLSAEAENVFFFAAAAGQIHFRVEAGKTVALILHEQGAEQVMPRVSAEEAAQASVQVEHRLQEQVRPRRLVSIPADILERYRGHYRIDDRHVTVVTAEDGHLYVQMGGQPKCEIFPESETKFFLTVSAAQVEFFLDHNQRVSHAVLHQFGRLIPMPRLEEAAA